ncbi:MAG: carboxylating nicotinate-nucleotide diphosphorylase [Theionarchaea archaeon]|nr:carboxylating nicotinate-nucleotide diphosphorylase [Theionarchaea archaeon]MBU7037480.1 carboxylating nicotinate-nucleotide diphosphorylase [Theionarchaea archaeon]
MDMTAETILNQLLVEDIGFGDITSQLLVDERGTASIITKEDCILSGAEYAKYLFDVRGADCHLPCHEGQRIANGTAVLTVEGLYRTIFEVERTALNLLTRMSGIATQTRTLVDMVHEVNPHCRVAATRKTVLRYFDKRAVITGGGDPHRFRLDDLILLKDNHVKILGIREALTRARQFSFSKKVEIEVSTVEDAVTACKCGADIIMLDNMDLDTTRNAVEAVKKISPGVLVEASGNMTQENITAYAETGVDIISLGTITHSVRAINMSLEVV